MGEPYPHSNQPGGYSDQAPSLPRSDPAGELSAPLHLPGEVPTTHEGWYQHTVESMDALRTIGEVIAQAEPSQGQEGYYQGYAIPAAGARVNYIHTHGADPMESEWVVKVQPPARMEDVPDDATMDQVMAAYQRYEIARTNPDEYIWEGATAHNVRVQRTDAEGAVSEVVLNEQETDQLIRDAHVLRGVAIAAAAATDNRAVLHQLLPAEHLARRKRPVDE